MTPRITVRQTMLLSLTPRDVYILMDLEQENIRPAAHEHDDSDPSESDSGNSCFPHCEAYFLLLIVGLQPTSDGLQPNSKGPPPSTVASCY